MTSTKCRINGETWTVKVISPKQMKKLYGKKGDAAAGLAVSSERTIYIDQECIEYGIIAHELWHAYWAGLHLDDTNDIKLHDAEEIAANMFAAKGDRIARQAKRVLKELRRDQ